MYSLQKVLISLGAASLEEHAAKLADLGDPRAIPDIIALADRANRRWIVRINKSGPDTDPSPHFDYANFAKPLKKLDSERVIAHLVADFHNSNKHENAKELLFKLCDPRAVDPMLAIVQDPNSGLRWAAIAVLSALRDRRAVDPLIAIVKTGGWQDKKVAAQALGHIGDARAVPALIRCMTDGHKDCPRADWVWGVRQETAQALGRIGDAAASDALIDALSWPESPEREKPGEFTRSAFGYWHEAAVWALSKTAGRSAIPTLASVLGRKEKKAPPEGRQMAVKVLGELQDPSAIPALIEAMTDRSIRKEICDTLVKFDDDRAKAVVLEERKAKEHCLVCGKTKHRAMRPSASKDLLDRAGGDRVVAQMVSYMNAIEDGSSGIGECSKCGRWACRSCFRGKRIECPGCDRTIIP